MVIGAGAAGSVIIRELLKDSHSKQTPVCIIDDNENKWGRELLGIPITGGRDTIIDKAITENISTIIFAIPTATPQEKKEKVKSMISIIISYL